MGLKTIFYLPFLLLQTETDCGHPPQVANTTSHNTGRTVGSKARYSCLPDYVEAGGDNTKICGKDGLWTGQDISCTCKFNKPMFYVMF